MSKATATGRVRTAVLPVAGLGTRFLPITKSVPKEMLPIVDKPTVQVIIEEAFAAGVERIVLVNGRHKGVIEDHFDHAFELERTLRDRGRDDDVAALEAVTRLGVISSVRQKAPLGLGHAVLCARPLVGDEPFAVLLGDDLVLTEPGQTPGIGQLIEAFERTGRGQIALMTVSEEDISKYGAANVTPADDGGFVIDGLVEKPPPGTAQTDKAVIGRYVLPAAVFDLLEQTQPGRGGEIQLTDALEALRARDGLMGRVLAGCRVDAGDRLGYLEANLRAALARADLAEPLRALMRALLEEA